MKYINIVKYGDDASYHHHIININWVDDDENILLIIKEELIKYFNETRMISEDDKQQCINFFSFNLCECTSIEKLNNFINKSFINGIFNYSINNSIN